MDRNNEPTGCPCGERYSDLLKAPPPEKDWLRKTTCPKRRKVYWTNKDTDYCIQCEPFALAPSLSKSGST